MTKSKNDTHTFLLGEILKWIKFLAMPQVRAILVSVLDTDQKKIVYQISDGTKSMKQVGRISGVNRDATISDYWKSWSKQNLGQRIPVRGGERFKRDFDLEDFGIDLPEINEEKTPKGKPREKQTRKSLKEKEPKVKP